jgi:hypothetical protein
MDANTARSLAQEFLASGKANDHTSFNVTGAGSKPNEEIVITITRTSSEPVKKALVKLSEAQSMSPYAAGNVCGACNGSGRL